MFEEIKCDRNGNSSTFQSQVLAEYRDSELHLILVLHERKIERSAQACPQKLFVLLQGNARNRQQFRRFGKHMALRSCHIAGNVHVLAFIRRLSQRSVHGVKSLEFLSCLSWKANSLSLSFLLLLLTFVNCFVDV